MGLSVFLFLIIQVAKTIYPTIYPSKNPINTRDVSAFIQLSSFSEDIGGVKRCVCNRAVHQDRKSTKMRLFVILLILLILKMCQYTILCWIIG
jgi:hypothetical protein